MMISLAWVAAIFELVDTWIRGVWAYFSFSEAALEDLWTQAMMDLMTILSTFWAAGFSSVEKFWDG